MTRPRIEDVAARAGTSPITVSRVLRAPDKVAPATRARVTAAIAALGYIPDLAASSLPSRRGRRRLAFVGGRDHRARARAAGFAAALQHAGAPAPTLAAVEGIAVGEGRRAVTHILATAPETEGVFFATDILAVGALLECQRRAIAVPDRLAIAALGDLEIARELTPALTT